MYTAVITKSGQVTLPKELREFLGFELGEKIVFKKTRSGVKIERRLTDKEFLDEIRAIHKKHGSASGKLPNATDVVRAFRNGEIEEINAEYARRYGV